MFLLQPLRLSKIKSFFKYKCVLPPITPWASITTPIPVARLLKRQPRNRANPPNITRGRHPNLSVPKAVKGKAGKCDKYAEREIKCTDVRLNISSKDIYMYRSAILNVENLVGIVPKFSIHQNNKGINETQLGVIKPLSY